MLEKTKEDFGEFIQEKWQLEIPPELLCVTEGEWKKFEKGSSWEELIAATSRFTRQPILEKSLAMAYLYAGKVYVYFSKNKKGESVVPRILVYVPLVKDFSPEVKGIAPYQNLDPNIIPVLEEKLKEKTEEIQNIQELIKRLENMKRIGEIYQKHCNNQEMSIEDLKFLYGIDHKIEVFGSGKDYRVEEMKKERNLRKDLAKIFGCPLEEITITQTEALERISSGKRIIFHYGSLNLSNLALFKGFKLPNRIHESLFLGIRSIEDLKDLALPKVGGYIFVDHLSPEERRVLRERYKTEHPEERFPNSKIYPVDIGELP